MEKNNKKLGTFFVRNLIGWLLMLVPLLLFFIIVWRPIIIGIGYSFFDLVGFTPTEFVGLENYKDVLSDTNFVKTLWNTVKYVLYSLVIGFPLPFIIAVLLNEMVHTKSLFKFTIYLPVLVPSMAAYLIWKVLYAAGDGGLINSVIGLFGADAVNWLGSESNAIPSIIMTMTWSGFGGTMLMHLATLQGINQELYDAARLDGAGIWRRFTTVMFPHMRGILLLLGVRQIIGVFSVTEQPLVMTGGGPNGASLSLGLTNYFYAFRDGNFERSLAVGVVSFLILICVTFIYYGLDKKISE